MPARPTGGRKLIPVPAFFHTHQLLISTLAPVHLGTGEDTDPTGYFLGGAGGKGDGADVVHFFDLARLARRGAPAPRWLEALAQEALNLAPGQAPEPLLRRIRQEIAARRTDLRQLTTRLALVSPEIARLYRDQLAVPPPPQFNQLQIQRPALTAAGDPYIPGSALKGAIRTAVISAMNAGRAASGGEAGWEERVLGGKFQNDPFRLISISDAADERRLGLDVLVASNRKRQPPGPGGVDAKGPPQYLECIPAFAFRAFRAALRWQTRADPAPGKGFPGTAAQLAQACNRFALPKVEEECGRFERRPGTALDPAWLEAIRARLKEAKPRLEAGNAFLLRLGRHSGALSVTADGVRRIKILRSPQPASEPTTAWFAGGPAGLLPLGWVLVEVLGAAECPPAWPQFLELAKTTHGPRTGLLGEALRQVAVARARALAAGAGVAL